MTELLPIIPGRPATIKIDGWTVYLAIHDQAYLREKRSWKRLLFSSHPDRGGRPTRFRNQLGLFQAWKKKERHWYWQFEMMPPDWKGSAKVAPPDVYLTRTGKYLRIDRRSQAYQELTA